MNQHRTSIARRGWTLLVCLTLLAATAQADDTDPEALYDQAIAAATQGSIEEAVALMEKVDAVVPGHPDVLWNLGIWYAQLARHETALAAWQRYREADPVEWRARAKLIQAYQALGRTDEVERERRELLDWYAAAPADSRPQQEIFCRDQFEANGRALMGFESFAPPGERMIFFRFSVLDAAGDEAFWYSLGSYETTTLIARQTGEIGKDARLYHLDRYDEGAHQTLGFYRELPTYEQVKQDVVGALQGEIEPVSSSTRKPG